VIEFKRTFMVAKRKAGRSANRFPVTAQDWS